MQNSMHDGIRASTESDRALFFGLRALNKHEAKCTTCVIQDDSCAQSDMCSTLDKWNLPCLA